MKKKLFVAGIMVILIISTIIILWQNYELSSDYNYFTAKLDIKNGKIQIVNVGILIDFSKGKDIEIIAAKYGFSNIYIKPDTSKQTLKGINNYNELVEAYLKVRNGIHWKAQYQQEVNLLYNEADTQKDSINHQP